MEAQPTQDLDGIDSQTHSGGGPALRHTRTCSCRSGGSMGTRRSASAGPSPKRSASIANCSAKPRCCVASTWKETHAGQLHFDTKAIHGNLSNGRQCRMQNRCAAEGLAATCAVPACCSWPLAVGGSADAASGAAPAAACTATADSWSPHESHIRRVLCEAHIQGAAPVS